MRAFILAGGFATRLWPLTEKRAKPLLPLAGRPLVSYLVKQIPEGIPITVSTNAVFADDFHAWKKAQPARRVPEIEILIEDTGHEDQKLGALGAVKAWIENEKIDDDVLLLAGDNYVGCPMTTFLSFALDRPLIAGHDIGSVDAARSFGTIVLEKTSEKVARVLSFEEKPEKPKSTIISTGWSFLPKSTLPALIEFATKHPDNIGGIFEEFLRKNIAVDCFVFTELWKDIGSFEAYLELHRSIVGPKTLQHETAVLKNADCRGSVDIGPNVTVEDSTLTDCIVFGNTTIKNCLLDRCIIDSGCTLEGIDLEGKMLRAGTVLRRP